MPAPITIALSLAISLALASAVDADEEQPLRPNVVVVIADDLGYGELGCYGGDLPTPALDALALEGVRFTAGYVTAPFCAASRAGLLTGRYQTRFGFEFNPIGPQNSDPAIGLPPNERTLADVLRDAGYVTGLVGKWHLGGTARYHPQRRGFDEFVGFLHEGHYYVPTPWAGHVTWLRRFALADGSRGRWTSPDGRVIWSTHLGHNEPPYDADNPLVRGSQPFETNENLTTLLTREAEQFIERHRSQPFFLCLTYNAVHSPMQAPDGYVSKFAHIGDIHRRLFAAMLAQLDDGVGRVVKKLHDCGLDERTLVVFLSDNGGPTRELTSSNRPLRGEKSSLLEGGIRVPFIMRWPKHLPAGRIEPRPVSSLDIFATAARAEGASPKHSDGVDLLPYLASPDVREIHGQLYWRVGSQGALRAGDWKIHRPRESKAKWELYNIADDAAEEKDLAPSHSEKLDALVKAWEKLDAEMVAPLWGPRGK